MKLGIEQLDLYLDLFKDKKVGLITNPTGMDQNFVSTIDILKAKTNLVSLYAPEHGVRGDLQAGVRLENYVDKETGCQVFSLYGNQKKPTEAMLKDVDVLCFDIQDVGARFYTFIYTMAYAMMACAEQHKTFVVFDRPNPVGGMKVEGNILDVTYRSFVGYYPLTQRYGLTIGELAVLFNEHFEIGCDLKVIPMKDYDRRLDFDDLGLSWVLPSPNIPTALTAYNYLATCYFEGTNVSEGRGTTKPFDIVGAPWLDARKVIEKLNDYDLKGVGFRRLFFTPTFSKHKDELCEGIELIVKDKHTYEPVKTGMILLNIIKETHEDFKFLPPYKKGLNPMIDLLTGDNVVRTGAMKIDQLLKNIEADSQTFEQLKGTYHLYD